MRTLIDAYNQISVWEDSITDSFFGMDTLLTAAKGGMILWILWAIDKVDLKDYLDIGIKAVILLTVCFKLGSEIWKWRNRKGK